MVRVLEKSTRVPAGQRRGARMGPRVSTGRSRPAGSRAANSPETGRYEILLKIVKTANDKLDPSSVLSTIMDNVQRLIPCEAWSILLLSEEGNELTFERARGHSAERLADARLRLGEGIAGWVAQCRKAVIVNNAQQDHRFSSAFDKATRFCTRSVLCAPLVSRGRLLGVVELINRRGERSRFLNDDLRTLQTLLAPVAASLHNAILYQQAEKLVVTDDLTKLYNNRYVNQCLKRLIQSHRPRNRRFSVIFLDLDGFKAVNDCYGHLIGGRTLVEVGKIIRETVKKKDVVARYGGDEFIVVLPDSTPTDAFRTAERIRTAIHDYDFLSALDREIHLSASFGISVFPDHGETVIELIQKADNAMYQVKYSGKDAVLMAR